MRQFRHRERFDAALRLLRVDDVAFGEDTVNLEGVATSKRLRAWKLDSVNGIVPIGSKWEPVRRVELRMKLGLW